MQIKTEISDMCLNGGDVEQMISAMACHIANDDASARGLVLVGINAKGTAIARRIARHMVLAHNVRPPIGRLDIAWRETAGDCARGSSESASSGRGCSREVQSVDLPFCIDDASLVVVDDVAFTGCTAKKAFEVLRGVGKPASLQLATLVDRFSPNPVVRPDISGVQLDVPAHKMLLVFLEEIDGFSEVLVRRGW